MQEEKGDRQTNKRGPIHKEWKLSFWSSMLVVKKALNYDINISRSMITFYVV